VKEPLRLRDDPSVSDDLRSVLGSGAVSRVMTPSQRARTSKGIAAVAAVPVATASLFGLKGIAIAAVVLGGSVVAASSLSNRWSSETTDETAPPARAFAATPPRTAAPAPPAPTDEQAPPAPSAIDARPPSPPAATPAVRPPVDSLRAEAATLERARSLVARDPSAALSVLEQHAREFPKGKLSVERELIAVDALRRAGRVSEARGRGEALLARTQGGLYEGRVRDLLESLR
jgi:hypothetical protein